MFRSAVLRFALLLLAFWVAGGQWLTLQSVAWIGMIRTYSQGASLSQALGKTFDGNHPCCLCRFIQKEKAAQDNPAKTAIPSSFKVEWVAAVFVSLFAVFSFFRIFLSPSTVWADWVRRPLSPPPKFAFLQ